MQQVVVCGRNFRVMRTTPSATLTAPAAATGEDDDQAEPMPSDHPDVQAGAIRDAVDVDGTVCPSMRAAPERGLSVPGERLSTRYAGGSAFSGQVHP